MWYIHTQDNIKLLKKKGNLNICDKDEPWEHDIKWNKSDKDKYCMTYLHGESKNPSNSQRADWQQTKAGGEGNG